MEGGGGEGGGGRGEGGGGRGEGGGGEGEGAGGGGGWRGGRRRGGEGRRMEVYKQIKAKINVASYTLTTRSQGPVVVDR